MSKTQYSPHLITTALQRWSNMAEQINNTDDAEYIEILADVIQSETQSLLDGKVPDSWLLFGDTWINEDKQLLDRIAELEAQLAKWESIGEKLEIDLEDLD